METTAAGEDIVLVVRLQAAADGSWYLQVDDQSHMRTIPLAPATLVIRLRRLGELGLLRGTIRLEGDQPGSGVESDLEWKQRAAAKDDRRPWRHFRQNICRHFIKNKLANTHGLRRNSTQLNASAAEIVSSDVI